MAEVLKGEVDFVFEGETFTFRFGGAAMMAIEQAFDGRPFLDVLRDLADRDSKGGTPIGDIAKLVQCGLRWHHAGVTLDEAAEMAGLDHVQVAMGEAIKLAFPKPEGGDGDADADPRRTPGKARRRATRDGTGTTRSAGGSKRVAKSTTSSAQRPA